MFGSDSKDKNKTLINLEIESFCKQNHEVIMTDKITTLLTNIIITNNTIIEIQSMLDYDSGKDLAISDRETNFSFGENKELVLNAIVSSLKDKKEHLQQELDCIILNQNQFDKYIEETVFENIDMEDTLWLASL